MSSKGSMASETLPPDFPPGKGNIAVIVHGGAGKLHPERAARKVPYLEEAVDQAWKRLADGESGLRAVESAMRVLEGSEYFNAGFGGYPNKNGIVLLDVGVMAGDRRFVSLLNVRRVKYPSAIAIDMLEDTDTLMTLWTHERMLALDKETLEKKERYGLVDSHENLIAPSVREMLTESSGFEVEHGHGTVGCVVRDMSGQLFSCTSTGGTYLKANGRIGDTPFVGCGVFADNDICALSTTGHGETLMRGLVSGFLIADMRRALREDPDIFSKDPALAKEYLEEELRELRRKVPERGGGIIIIPKGGPPAFACNLAMLAVGYRCGTAEEIAESDAFILTQNGRLS